MNYLQEVSDSGNDMGLDLKVLRTDWSVLNRCDPRPTTKLSLIEVPLEPWKDTCIALLSVGEVDIFFGMLWRSPFTAAGLLLSPGGTCCLVSTAATGDPEAADSTQLVMSDICEK
jgi:hypothetical protein